MELESSFSVVAPIDVVWKVLMDFDRVASAVPGAEILNRLSDDALQVGMKVKLATYVVGTDDEGTEAIGFGFEPLEA